MIKTNFSKLIIALKTKGAIFLISGLYLMQIGCKAGAQENINITSLSNSMSSLDSLVKSADMENMDPTARLNLEDAIDQKNDEIRSSIKIVFKDIKTFDKQEVSQLENIPSLNFFALSNNEFFVLNWDSYTGGRIPYYNIVIATKINTLKYSVIDINSSDSENGINFYVDTVFAVGNKLDFFCIKGKNVNEPLCEEEDIIILDAKKQSLVSFRSGNESRKYLSSVNCDLGSKEKPFFDINTNLKSVKLHNKTKIIEYSIEN